MNYNQEEIEWTKIVNTEKPVNFCQIDSISGGYILTYSHSASISGGLKIIRLNVNSDTKTLNSSTLFESIKNLTEFVYVANGNIGFIQSDFEENTLRSKFLFSPNLGKTWGEIKTPFDKGITKFILTKKFLLTEGMQMGNMKVYMSSDSGKTWNEINTLKKGFKSFYILQNENEKIVCKGAKSFNEKDSKLLLFDPISKIDKELLDIDGFNYLKPISKIKNLHGIIGGHRLKVYSLTKDELILEKTISLPNKFNDVKNVFLGVDYLIITAREEKLLGKTLSWISYDFGNNWRPYEHKRGLQLVDNNLGELFMIDSNNDILQGE
jgi:hypothetical protein